MIVPQDQIRSLFIFFVYNLDLLSILHCFFVFLLFFFGFVSFFFVLFFFFFFFFFFFVFFFFFYFRFFFFFFYFFLFFFFFFLYFYTLPLALCKKFNNFSALSASQLSLSTLCKNTQHLSLA